MIVLIINYFIIYIIEIYYNDWCEFCIELLKIIDEIFEKNKYLLDYFEYKKYLIIKDFDYNYDNYFNFLPRFHINDNFKNVTYDYFGDLKKIDIFKFIVNKINIIYDFEQW